MTHSVKLKLDPTGHGSVEVDGQKVEMARAVTLSARADDATTATIEIVAPHLDVEVEPLEVHLVPDVCPECDLKADIRHCIPIPRAPFEDEEKGYAYFSKGPRYWECRNGHWGLIGERSSAAEAVAKSELGHAG